MVVGVAAVLAVVSALHRWHVAQVPAGGLLRAPFGTGRGTGRMLPVVACASKEAQAADLKLQVAALKAGVAFSVPRPGESVEPAKATPMTPWWPKVPWRTAEESPVRSTGMVTPISEAP